MNYLSELIAARHERALATASALHYSERTPEQERAVETEYEARRSRALEAECNRLLADDEWTSDVLVEHGEAHPEFAVTRAEALAGSASARAAVAVILANAAMAMAEARWEFGDL